MRRVQALLCNGLNGSTVLLSARSFGSSAADLASVCSTVGYEPAGANCTNANSTARGV